MQEPDLLDTESSPRYGPWGHKLYQLTRLFAIAGGLGFVALVVMSLISIVGRKISATPVPGDIEVMQMGTAIASAAMLAYCEMERHHLRVDFFTANISADLRERLDSASHLLLALVAVLVAWRTGASALSQKEAGETSMILAWPVWMVVAAMVPSFALLALAGVYNAVQHWQLASTEGDLA